MCHCSSSSSTLEQLSINDQEFNIEHNVYKANAWLSNEQHSAMDQTYNELAKAILEIFDQHNPDKDGHFHDMYIEDLYDVEEQEGEDADDHGWPQDEGRDCPGCGMFIRFTMSPKKRILVQYVSNTAQPFEFDSMMDWSDYLPNDQENRVSELSNMLKNVNIGGRNFIDIVKDAYFSLSFAPHPGWHRYKSISEFHTSDIRGHVDGTKTLRALVQ